MLEVLSIVVGIVFGGLMSVGLVTLIQHKDKDKNKIKVFVEKNGGHGTISRFQRTYSYYNRRH